jgi:hypothetical protein
MTDIMMTDGMKQQVITRLATINSATSILSLINGRPAKVSVDEVLTLAERIERWAWRDLLGDRTPTQAPEKPTPPPTADKNPSQPLVTSNGDRPHPAPPPPKPNGPSQWGGGASEKQINAIFAIGRSKGYEADDVKALVGEKIGKNVMQLTSREASKLIDDLKAA